MTRPRLKVPALDRLEKQIALRGVLATMAEATQLVDGLSGAARLPALQGRAMMSEEAARQGNEEAPEAEGRQTGDGSAVGVDEWTLGGGSS